MSQRKTSRRSRTKGTSPPGRYWTLTLKTKESAINFYSLLTAFQQAEGILKKAALRVVGQWVTQLRQQVSDIEEIAHDQRGPYRERLLAPLNVDIPVHIKNRALMQFMCQTMYAQMQNPKDRQHWIENQGREDYELAVQDYQLWMQQLEGAGVVRKAGE